MDRPIRPMAMNSSMNSGLAGSSSLNSSITTIRLGSGGSGWPASRRRLYSVMFGRFPASAKSCWRRFISPNTASCSRSTSPSSSDRFEIIAAQCGMSSKPANVAPPL